MRKCSLSTRATPRTCSQAPPAEIITISASTTFRFVPSRSSTATPSACGRMTGWNSCCGSRTSHCFRSIERRFGARELLASSPASARTITDLINTVQEHALRDALGRYSVTGPLGRFLDADQDGLDGGRFQTFEIETLMSLGEQVLLPVLSYLFHAIDRRLDGRPTLIVLDEAWVMLANGAFGAKIEEWLRTLRKKN